MIGAENVIALLSPSTRPQRNSRTPVALKAA